MRGGQYTKCKIIEQPYVEAAETYIVQDMASSDIIQKEASELLPADPTSTINISSNDTITNIPWIHNNSKVTIILPIYQRSKQGFIQYDETKQEWSFRPGRTKNNPPIPLPRFEINVESMINAKKLFQGWCSAHRVLTARRVQATSNTLAALIINRKVSAKDLDKTSAPTLLKHYLLSNKQTNMGCCI